MGIGEGGRRGAAGHGRRAQGTGAGPRGWAGRSGVSLETPET